ncbi:IS6 family transposase, partial [Marivita cryptomonadis]|uniref:IS6 family transposase n=2 Tax=Marivita cryptomonadis TaxID=505252 RepID=UPI001EEE0365
MTKAKLSGTFKGHRFPPEIIAFAIWSYFRFPLSLRDVEDLLAARGVIVSYETIRKWIGKFGTSYAAPIRRDRPAPSDKWHLDEVVIPIRGRRFWLWRAIDSNGDVLDILVQSRRNTRAAKRFFRKLFKQYGCQRQSKSEPKGIAKCCHFGFGIISVKTSASIRAAALV